MAKVVGEKYFNFLWGAWIAADDFANGLGTLKKPS